MHKLVKELFAFMLSAVLLTLIVIAVFIIISIINPHDTNTNPPGVANTPPIELKGY